ncbi:MAG: apolipoprotein N-acyltransferase [Alphaproteobacteria bacterium]
MPIAMLICGATAALALPPLYILPAALLAFAILFHLLNQAPNPKTTALLTFPFATGYFAAGLWWIAVAFSFETSDLKYLAIPAVILLVIFNASFWTLATLPLPYLKTNTSRLLAFPALLTTAEILRAHILGGFPWNPISSFWAFSTPSLQPLAWIGSDLWSALTLLAAAALAPLASQLIRKPQKQNNSTPRIIPLPILLIAILIPPLLILTASSRLLTPTQYFNQIQLRIVQPNIPQQNKWLPNVRTQNLRTQTNLIAQNQNFTHAILPEAAVVWPLNQSPGIRSALTNQIPTNGALITGGITQLQNNQQTTLHNSVYVLAANGDVQSRYDKHKLVPFGEYIPFKNIAPLKKLTHGTTDYSPGNGPAILSAPGLPPFSPLICFEAIFSGRITPRQNHPQRSAQRPQWLLNVTNDTWFGNTPGPFQHFAAARMRAVEEGLPLVRAANSGISAVIDAHGRIHHQIPLNHSGQITSQLPKPLPKTLFAKLGLSLPISILTIWILLAITLNAIPPPTTTKPQPPAHI